MEPIKWPKEMPEYEPDHFQHLTYGDIINPDGYAEYRPLTPADVYSPKCGTQACLLGNVAVAFLATVEELKERPGAHQTFLRKFCEFAGKPVPKTGVSPTLHAERVFEGWSRNVKNPMSLATAARLYNKTCRYFGYTELVREPAVTASTAA